MEFRINHPVDIDTYTIATGSQLEEPFLLLRYDKPKGFALILLNQFTRTKLDAHIWTTGIWASKQLFNHLFNFIFEHMGFETLKAPILNKNERAKKLVKKLGFVKSDVKQGVSLYTLTKKDRKHGIY